MSLSIVINTLNEEENLPRLLRSIDKFADEVVVVDMKSEDDTLKIAKEFGAKVYSHDRTGYVEPARNFAISKASGEWILILDADEELSRSLKTQITEIIHNPNADYFRLPRKNIIFGKWLKHSGWWPDYNIRLFRKGYVDWLEEIHSIPITLGKGSDLPDDKDYAIIHHNYDSIDQYLHRMIRYTGIQSKQLAKDKYVFNWKDLLTKPANEFLSRYFQSQGYKDGLHGLAVSVLQSLTEFVVYLKVWELRKFDKDDINLVEVLSASTEIKKDHNYWKADALYRENGGIINRIKRKFKLP